MSRKEFQRVKVIENAAGRRLSVREASGLLQLSERQVQRLKHRYWKECLERQPRSKTSTRRSWPSSRSRRESRQCWEGYSRNLSC